MATISRRLSQSLSDNNKNIQQKLSKGEKIRRMQSHLQDTPQDWETLWKQNVSPWDLGRPTPLLRTEIKNRSSIFSNFRNLLIPGCGSGHDLKLLSRSCPNGNITGLDISPTSIQYAEKGVEDYSNVTTLCDDFFQFQHQKFDFVFDYLFFSALPPTMREQWADRMRDIIMPSGCLLTVIFPCFEEGDVRGLGGPPYHATIDHYEAVLCCRDFVKTEGPYVSDDTVEDRQGKEMVAWWQKI